MTNLHAVTSVVLGNYKQPGGLSIYMENPEILVPYGTFQKLQTMGLINTLFLSFGAFQLILVYFEFVICPLCACTSCGTENFDTPKIFTQIAHINGKHPGHDKLKVLFSVVLLV